MAIPVEITFHGLEATEALRVDILDHAHRLERFAPEILHCQVVIEPAEHRRHKGNRFTTRVRVTLPGAELNVGHTASGDQSHEDAYVAVRDAFRAIRRKLQDFRRERQGKVKKHEPPSEGRVQSLDHEAGYGVIATPDGREVEFHRNSVIGRDFAKVAVGDRVRFAEVPGEEGPRASTVHLLTHLYGD
jgi:ribosome-associated translation inhibitor RaiA